METPEDLEEEKNEFRARLEAEGETEVRHKDSVGFYWRPQEQKWAREWLREQEKAKEAAVATERRENLESWDANLILILVAVIGILVAFILAR